MLMKVYEILAQQKLLNLTGLQYDSELNKELPMRKNYFCPKWQICEDYLPKICSMKYIVLVEDIALQVVLQPVYTKKFCLDNH